MSNNSLKNKMLASFIIVILLTGIITAIVGVRFIGENIVPKQKGRLDLNAAFQVYNDAEQDIITVIRLTSSRFFLVEGIKEYAGGGPTLRLAARLEKIRDTESLDFLNIADTSGKLIVRGRNPGVTMSVHATDAVVRRALQKRKATGSTEIFTGNELLTEGEALVSAVAKYSDGDNTVQSTDGMAIVGAAPVLDENGGLCGVIYGGKLLNGNFAVVDKIVDLIYEREEYNRREICVSTIFMHDERISTNIRSNRDFSSIGTKLPADIYGEILAGDTVVNRKVVVAGHPYRVAYGPIRNISGEAIGILGVGILEEKIWGTQRRALFIFIAITFGALLLSISISQWLAGRIMHPIKSLLLTTAKIAKGNYDQKVDLHNAPEEIAALGNEFNRMIASIKERDRKLMDQAQQEVMRADRLAMIGQLAAGVAHDF
ncbi:MAG: cache domain-containing protein, partial [Chitinispirillaceae bacterium]|nr:cache domain-containing protein [Chitinispirillaceae bacterium]